MLHERGREALEGEERATAPCTYRPAVAERRITMRHRPFSFFVQSAIPDKGEATVLQLPSQPGPNRGNPEFRACMRFGSPRKERELKLS